MSSSDSPDVTGPLGPVATLEICEIRWTRGEGWSDRASGEGRRGEAHLLFREQKTFRRLPDRIREISRSARERKPPPRLLLGGGGRGLADAAEPPGEACDLATGWCGTPRRSRRGRRRARSAARRRGGAARRRLKNARIFSSRSRGTVAKWHSVGGARARWRSRRRAGGRTHREVTLAGANRGARGESLRIEPGEGWEAGRLDRGRRRGGGNPPPGCPMLGASEEKRVPTVLDRATATARTRPSRSRPGRESIERVWTPIDAPSAPRRGRSRARPPASFRAATIFG